MHPLIEKVLTYSNHKAGIPGSISVTRFIGSSYQAKLHLEQREKDHEVPAINRRGAAIGSGFHLWCEQALADDPNIYQEIYNEKTFEDILFTGTCDLLQVQKDGSVRLGDWKTGVTPKFEESKIERTRLQMSMYRWMLLDKYPDISLEADIYYISTSRNVTEHHEVLLMTEQQVEDFISSKLYLINSIEVPDCESWLCEYCEFSCEHRRYKKQKGE